MEELTMTDIQWVMMKTVAVETKPGACLITKKLDSMALGNAQPEEEKTK